VTWDGEGGAVREGEAHVLATDCDRSSIQTYFKGQEFKWDLGTLIIFCLLKKGASARRKLKTMG